MKINRSFALQVGCSTLVQYNELVMDLELTADIDDLIRRVEIQAAKDVRAMIETKCNFKEKLFEIDSRRKQELIRKNEEKVRSEAIRAENERSRIASQERKKLVEKEVVELDKVCKEYFDDSTLDDSPFESDYDIMFEKFSKCCVHEADLKNALLKIDELLKDNQKLAFAGKNLRNQIQGYKELFRKRNDWRLWTDADKKDLFDEVVDHIKDGIGKVDSNVLVDAFKNILDAATDKKKRQRTISF